MNNKNHPGLSVNYFEAAPSRKERVLDRIATFSIMTVDADNQKDANHE